MTARYSSDANDTVHTAFKQWSSDGSTMTRHEFKCAYISIVGLKPAKANWELVPKQGPEGTISLDAFRAAMQASLECQDASEHVRHIFKAFDMRSAGYISREDAHAVFRNSAPSVSSRVVDEVFDELDLDHDGRVSCSDFMTMMRIRVP